MLQHQELALQRSFSCSTRRINPETSRARMLSFFLRAIINLVNLPFCNVASLPSLPSSPSGVISLATSRSSSLGRRVTGTLYGYRRGHVTFSVQDGPRTDPLLLLDLAISMETLAKEMSSGLVRIALECEKRHRSGTKLFHEPKWTMYCNGRKCGASVSRGGACTELDWSVLNTVSSVTVGAGVIPTENDVSGGGTELGELLYMRGRYERVVGSRDSEAFYMMNPDENEGPELSIFLLRI